MTFGRSRRAFVFLVSLGLAVRLATSFFWGTQDVEFWKAYATEAVRRGVTTIYGASDAAIVAAYRRGAGFHEVVESTQRLIDFEPHEYFRTRYRCVQPPLFVYPLALLGLAYQSIEPAMPNQRLFNALLNLAPITASGLISLVIYVAVLRRRDRTVARLTALGYWLNPLVILNSPVQGYMDPLVALPALISVVAAATGRLTLSYIALTCAILTKPQGVLIAPVVLLVGWMHQGRKANLKAIVAAALTTVVVFLPFLVFGQTLSVVHGVLSIERDEGNISRQAMNLWWPAQYALNARSAVERGGDVPRALLGSYSGWETDRLSTELPAGFHVTPVRAGLLLLLAATVLNLVRLARRPLCLEAVVEAAAFQVFAYFVLRVGVHSNHYFLMVPLLVLLTGLVPGRLRHSATIFGLFFAADLLFYGLGRDWRPLVGILTRYSLGWLSLVLSVGVVAAFVSMALPSRITATGGGRPE